MGIHVVLEGKLVGGETKGALAGIVIKAAIAGSNKPVASAVTDGVGAFRLSIAEPGEAFWRPSAAVRLALHAGGAEAAAFYRSGTLPLKKWPREGLTLAVPQKALSAAFSKPKLTLLADGERASEIAVGQTLSVSGSRLQPSCCHEIRLRNGRETTSTLQLTTDAFGTLAPTVIAPQFGLAASDSSEAFTLSQASKRVSDQPVIAEVWCGGERLARLRMAVARRATRPMGFICDSEGRLRNAVQWDEDPLHLFLTNVPKQTPLRAYVVPRQEYWRPQDPIEPSADRNGRPLILELGQCAGTATLQLAEPGRLLPGAYDIIVRPVRYGYEADEELALRASDIVVSHHTTGLVVREGFWRSKVMLGGCVNALSISGSLVMEKPYYRYRDAFAVGQDVWAALDPGIVMPGQFGKKVAFYVIPSKTPDQWALDTSLTHAPPGVPIELPVQSGCINANRALVWPSANIKGSYDIVADFGNNSSNPATFVKDGSYDTPLDMIDGYFQPGFRVVDDPGTMEEFAHIGAFSVDAALLASLGLAANLTTTDENHAYFTPGDYVPLTATIPRRAIVRFPADMAGATSASQLSLARPDYPLVVVVHGNGHNYLSYGFLLDHLARNGFIAAAFFMPDGPHGLFRANCFFDHLNTLRTIFGTRVQNNVGVLGHSRGGEAAFKIARLNQSEGLGIGLNALIALAPTDQYGRETITGAAATPLLVLYGAKDGEVSGWPPFAGYNVRQSGFSLYDRFDGARKSMAFVYDATHNGFVTFNEAPTTLDVEDQRTVLRAYSNAFFRRNLRNETEWEGMFTGEWKPPSVGSSPAGKIYFQYRHPTRRAIDDFEGAHTATSWQTSTIGAAVDQVGLPATPIETQLYPQDIQSPHDTGGLRLTWNNIGDRLVAHIPAGQGDVTGFAAVSLRVGQVVGSASNPAGAQNFRVTLRDVHGVERAIRVGAFGAVPEPAEANMPGNKKSAMATIRIPLTAYTVVCGGAVPVDLTNVTRVILDFWDIATGEIALDEIEFTH